MSNETLAEHWKRMAAADTVEVADLYQYYLRAGQGSWARMMNGSSDRRDIGLVCERFVIVALLRHLSRTGGGDEVATRIVAALEDGGLAGEWLWEWCVEAGQ